MKVIKKKIGRTVYEEKELKITNVIHDLPTWMFPYSSFSGNEKEKCPVCHQEMRMQIGHGSYIETCSMIQIDGYHTHPIHKECFDKLEDFEICQRCGKEIATTKYGDMNVCQSCCDRLDRQFDEEYR